MPRSGTDSLTLRGAQKRNAEIYGRQDDRFYSTLELLTQLQRFTMRALKGVRKGDSKKLKLNLVISFSWLMAIANRLHIDMEDELWMRFPGACSYCGRSPCRCKKTKPKTRKKLRIHDALRPKTLADSQLLFQNIYPPNDRTLSNAGVHLAEESGEVSEAIHNFSGLHLNKWFDEVRYETADYLSCLFGVANSANIHLSEELDHMFRNGCHACHKTPCECTFTTVVGTKS